MYNEDSGYYEGNNNGFVAGLLAGVTVGLGLGMLFAPRTGAEMRRTIAGSASDLKQAAADTYKQTSERVRDIVDRGKDQAREAVRTAQDAVNEASYGHSGTTGSVTSNPGSGL